MTSLELMSKLSKIIPTGIQAGSDMAGSFKYSFRSRDDPRYSDRRMQSLLRKISSQRVSYSPKDQCKVLYNLVKLRFPEDELINYLT